MQPNTAKITIIFSLSAIILLGGGCAFFKLQPFSRAPRQLSSVPVTSSQPANPTAVPGSENIMNGIFDMIMEKKDIQKFIDQQHGILSKYKEDSSDGLRTVAEELDQVTTLDLPTSLNPRVFLVLMELKSSIVTRPNVTDSEVRNVFGVTTQQYIDWLIKYINARRPSEKLSPGEITELKGQFSTTTLLMQLEYVTDKFMGAIFEEQSSRKIIFKNGDSFQPAANINSETYAIQAIMADLADSQEQWELWVSKKPGSFYQTYKQWFGDPVLSEDLK
ncbi:MAG: hypothetical protein HYV42_03215 [Candidatus Magasanikbacteria bacterium]|nr:hypothetical protein [Candidatus Magasanikbacteria bacterium]